MAVYLQTVYFLALLAAVLAGYDTTNTTNSTLSCLTCREISYTGETEPSIVQAYNDAAANSTDTKCGAAKKVECKPEEKQDMCRTLDMVLSMTTTEDGSTLSMDLTHYEKGCYPSMITCDLLKAQLKQEMAGRTNTTMEIKTCSISGARGSGYSGYVVMLVLALSLLNST